MSLRKWIPRKDYAHILDDIEVTRLIDALSIAWEALEQWPDGVHTFTDETGSKHTDDCYPCAGKKALHRIEELGKESK